MKNLFPSKNKFERRMRKRTKEIYEELGQKIIEVSDCDFDANATYFFLNSNGYVYFESNEFGSEKYDVELVGYLDSTKMDYFMGYLLDEEKILMRKRIPQKMVIDYNISIEFNYKNKKYFIPDDIFCSNNKISKYYDNGKGGDLSSRIVNKLCDLVTKTVNIEDYTKRLELRRELEEMHEYSYEDDADSPIENFIKNK